MHITLLLPVLNEIDGLKFTLPRIDRRLFADIVVIDGGSTDGSVQYAESQGVRIVTQRRKGLSYAYLDAIRDLRTDYVVSFSPDGNCLTDQLGQIVRLIRQGFDLVVVSRYLPPAHSYDDTWVTRLGNWGFTVLFNFMGPNRITDSLTIYRGFRRDLVDSPGFESLCYGPVFEPLITGLVNVHRLRYTEIPGDEPARIGGQSKMRVFYNGSCILLLVFRLYLRKIGIRV
jgi:glycosyltransferase involved in cell wall biosynthesis